LSTKGARFKPGTLKGGGQAEGEVPAVVVGGKGIGVPRLKEAVLHRQTEIGKNLPGEGKVHLVAYVPARLGRVQIVDSSLRLVLEESVEVHSRGEVFEEADFLQGFQGNAPFDHPQVRKTG